MSADVLDYCTLGPLAALPWDLHSGHKRKTCTSLPLTLSYIALESACRAEELFWHAHAHTHTHAHIPTPTPTHTHKHTQHTRHTTHTHTHAHTQTKSVSPPATVSWIDAYLNKLFGVMVQFFTTIVGKRVKRLKSIPNDTYLWNGSATCGRQCAVVYPLSCCQHLGHTVHELIVWKLQLCYSFQQRCVEAWNPLCLEN